MSLVDDVAKFLRDLILGDFADEPSSASVMVNGAIGLIPVVDQFMDVRDIAGCIYRCSGKGWANLGENDYADLAFAAIGVIPSFGSAFKGAVKPLWKERKAVGRGVENGVAMLERLLGSQKGGAIKWLREIDWAGRTNQAIAATQEALALYIRVLEAIAADPWWAPAWLVSLAVGILPGVRESRGHLDKAVREGSRLVREFLGDLLGEHAVWVAAAASVSPSRGRGATASHAMHREGGRQANQRRGHAAGREPDPRTNQLKEPHGKVAGQQRQTVKTGEGLVDRASQRTRDFLEDMSGRPMGLVAEHMVDYHVLGKLGATYKQHATAPKGSFSGDWEKINGFKRPVELFPEDLTQHLRPGIDSLWKNKTTGRYRVVEAKGRVGAPSDNTEIAARTVEQEKKNAKGKTTARQSKSKIPPLPQPNNLTPSQAQLWRMLHDTSDKGVHRGAMQMSRPWIKTHMRGVLGDDSPVPYDRFVYLVTSVPSTSGPAAPGVADHLKSLGDALTPDDIDHKLHEPTQGISVEYDEGDIAKVEALRSRTYKPEKPDQTLEPSGEAKKPSARKPTKGKS